MMRFHFHRNTFGKLRTGQAANGLLLRSSAESIENSLKVNLHGAIYGTQQAIQRMIRQKSGGETSKWYSVSVRSCSKYPP